jgi:hypothetical protein
MPVFGASDLAAFPETLSGCAGGLWPSPTPARPELMHAAVHTPRLAAVFAARLGRWHI